MGKWIAAIALVFSLASPGIAAEASPERVAEDSAHLMVKSLSRHAKYNPDSFKLQDYTFADKGEQIQVRANYTARNAYNSTVRHTVLFTVTPDGEPIEILEHR